MNPTIHYRDEEWLCECAPADGGRLTRLRWRDVDLLTGPDPNFVPGEGFESRPVYGYDDCFPCVAPQEGIPDHGFCWSMSPECVRKEDGLCCTFPFPDGVRLHRRLRFGEGKLAWAFRIENPSDSDLRAQHVMHALMPPSAIHSIRAPLCAECVDSLTGEAIPPESAQNPLALCAEGNARMLLLRGITAEDVDLQLCNGHLLRIQFDPGLFPTLGLWMDRGGYPEHAPRQEIAVEPIPGPSGSLKESLDSGQALYIPARGRLDWEIQWSFRVPASAGSKGGFSPRIRAPETRP